ARVSRPFQSRRRVQAGGKTVDVPIQQRDDYALIILDQDIAGTTHAKMNGALGYWGQNPSVAVLKRVEPSAIDGKDIAVIGYPGDTCGNDKWTGSASSKKNQIDTCFNRRKDEWASTSWRDTGTLAVDPTPNSTTVFHTAATHESHSGA